MPGFCYPTLQIAKPVKVPLVALVLAGCGEEPDESLVDGRNFYAEQRLKLPQPAMQTWSLIMVSAKQPCTVPGTIPQPDGTLGFRISVSLPITFPNFEA